MQTIRAKGSKFSVKVFAMYRSVSAAGDGLALLYNDTSVLESHHCAMAFQLMKKDGCNVLESFAGKKYQGVRRIIVDMASFVISYPNLRDVAYNIYLRSGGYVVASVCFCWFVGMYCDGQSH